jgi:hypothetical protein
MTQMLRWPVALVLLAAPALAIDVTAPGQTVPKGQVGVVQSDLACSSAGGVFLESGATLEMNGHVLDGCFVVGAGLSPVRIVVRGPGTIRNAGMVIREGSLRADDVVIEDSPSWGIIGSGDSQDGPSTLRLRNVTVTGSGFDGIRATKVVARVVTSSGNGVAPGFPGVGGWGIIGWGGVTGRNLVVRDNQGEGVFSTGKVKLQDSQVTGNLWGGVVGVGISSRALTLVRSTVTGNGALGEADLVSQRLPRLRDSTCGTSLDAQAQVPWGVCAND